MYDLKTTAERKQGQSHITWIINTIPLVSICYQERHIRNRHIHALNDFGCNSYTKHYFFFSYTPDCTQCASGV